MNQGLAEPVVHWSASGSILPRRTAACVRPARSCGTSSVRRAGTPSPAGTAALEIARKIAHELGSVPLNAKRRALVGYLSMLEG